MLKQAFSLDNMRKSSIKQAESTGRSAVQAENGVHTPPPMEPRYYSATPMQHFEKEKTQY